MAMTTHRALVTHQGCRASRLRFLRRMRPLVAASLILASGCGESPLQGTHQPARELEGSWRWVSSLDLSTQTLHTPQSEGYVAELKFTATSNRDGTFVYSRAGAPDVQGQFGIGSEDAPGNDFIVLEPGIDYLERNAWLGIGRDTLILNGVMESGYKTRYARVPAS